MAGRTRADAEGYRIIARRYRIPAISTGELFRAECKAGTPLAKQSCSIMAQGGLVDDEIVTEAELVAAPIGDAEIPLVPTAGV